MALWEGRIGTPTLSRIYNIDSYFDCNWVEACGFVISCLQKPVVASGSLDSVGIVLVSFTP